MTRRLRSRATTSIDMRIQQVCIPEDGVIQRPPPTSSERLPISPRKRVREESATAILSPIAVALDWFQMDTIFIADGMRLGVFRFATGNEDTQHNDEENTGDDTDNGCERHLSFSLNSDQLHELPAHPPASRRVLTALTLRYFHPYSRLPWPSRRAHLLCRLLQSILLD